MPEKGSTKEDGGRNTFDRKATTRERSSGPLGLPFPGGFKLLQFGVEVVGAGDFRRVPGPNQMISIGDEADE